MSRADKYSKQRIDRLKELCIKHPDYLMKDLAEEMGAERERCVHNY